MESLFILTIFHHCYHCVFSVLKIPGIGQVYLQTSTIGRYYSPLLASALAGQKVNWVPSDSQQQFWGELRPECQPESGQGAQIWAPSKGRVRAAWDSARRGLAALGSESAEADREASPGRWGAKSVQVDDQAPCPSKSQRHVSASWPPGGHCAFVKGQGDMGLPDSITCDNKMQRLLYVDGLASTLVWKAMKLRPRSSPQITTVTINLSWMFYCATSMVPSALCKLDYLFFTRTLLVNMDIIPILIFFGCTAQLVGS